MGIQMQDTNAVARIALTALVSVGLLASDGSAGTKECRGLDRENFVAATVEAICKPAVLKKLEPILVMERSISNKKLSKIGYQSWLKERRAHWLEARKLLDPIFAKHGFKPATLIEQVRKLYDTDAPALDAISRLVVKKVLKTCPKAGKEARLDFELEKVVNVVVYGYRQFP